MIKLYTKVQSYIASREAEVRDEGATMVEYGLIVSLVAIVAIAAATSVGTALKNKFVDIATAL